LKLQLIYTALLLILPAFAMHTTSFNLTKPLVVSCHCLLCAAQVWAVPALTLPQQ
jgi:hypothetical protein